MSAHTLNAQHTPGPWHVDQAAGGYYRTRLTVASREYSRPGVTDGRDCIAEVCRETEERAKADANLIAAAPDLLGAARYALSLIETIHPSDTADMLRDAIAKAEGR